MTSLKNRPATISPNRNGEWVLTTTDEQITFDSLPAALRSARDTTRKESPSAKAAPAWMIQRRLQALAAAGWDVRWISDETGLTPAEVTALTDGSAVSLSPRTCRSICETYSWVMRHTDGGQIRQCGPTPAAVENNWSPPAMWDDIDDPEEDHCPRVHIDEELYRILRVVIAAAGTDLKAAALTGISKTMICEFKIRRAKTMSSTAAARVRGIYTSMDEATRKLAEERLEVLARRRLQAA